MRIQILELPALVVGEDVTTPFALIFDQCPKSEPTETYQGVAIREDLGAVRDVAAFADSVGASGYFCTAETVELVDRFRDLEVEHEHVEERPTPVVINYSGDPEEVAERIRHNFTQYPSV